MLSPTPIRILSVEDHPVFWEGLRFIISLETDMELVAHAKNTLEALAAYREHQPDVTLMDVRLEPDSGIDTLISLRKEFPKAKVMMLTSFDNDVQRALKAGAMAYALKSAPKNELIGAIRTVHKGKRYISPEIGSLLAEQVADEGLTAREIEVLTLIQHGLRTKKIAEKLGIGETTVNFHIKNLMSKLQASDRTHAVTLALKRGLLRL